MNNITVKQIEFKSTNGVHTVFGWIYQPGGEPRGIVQISHGMAEHMGRYHDFMRFLAQNGYAACGIDHIGHGRSASDQTCGYFGDREGWRTLVDDQHKFNRIVRSEIPGCESALIGHSMGSFIARLFAAKYPQSIGALVLVGTARGGLKVKLAARAAGHSARKNGPKSIDRSLNKLVFGHYNDRIPQKNSKFDWLSRDAQSVSQYMDDPNCGFVLTAAAFCDLFALVSRANSQKTFEATSKELPVLLLSGSMDPVGEYGKGPAQVYDQYLKSGTADVGLVIYEGARHELIGEINREQVWNELIGWLGGRLAPPAPPDEPQDPPSGGQPDCGV